MGYMAVHFCACIEGIAQGASCLKTCGMEVSPGGKVSTCTSVVGAINTDCKLRNLSEEPSQYGSKCCQPFPYK